MTLRLLVVDDGEVITSTLKTLAVAEPPVVDRVSLASGALLLLQASHQNGNYYDFVFVDYYLFPARGTAIIKEIRKMETEKKLPRSYIVGCIPAFAEGIAEKMSRAGANIILPTPFEYRDLMACLTLNRIVQKAS